MKILIIEDDENVQALFILLLKGHEVLSAYDLATGIRLAQEHKPMLVFLDLILPDSLNPVETASQIEPLLKMIPAANVIVVTGHATEEVARVVERAGGLGVVSKNAPGGMRETVAEIHRVACHAEETRDDCRQALEKAIGCKL